MRRHLPLLLIVPPHRDETLVLGPMRRRNKLNTRTAGMPRMWILIMFMRVKLTRRNGRNKPTTNSAAAALQLCMVGRLGGCVEITVKYVSR